MKKLTMAVVLVSLLILVVNCDQEHSLVAPIMAPENFANETGKKPQIKTGTLTVRLAGGNPVSKIVLPEEKTTVLVLEFVATGTSYTITGLPISVLCAKKSSTIDFLEIDGTTAYPTRNNVIRFMGLNIFVPANGVGVKVVVLAQISANAKSGEEFMLALNKNIIAVDENGNKIKTINELISSKMVVRLSRPVVQIQYLPSVLYHGQQQVICISITADAAGGDLRLAGFKFNQQLSLELSCFNFSLEDSRGQTWSSATVNSGTICIFPEHEIMIMAGEIKTFYLTGETVGEFINDSYIKTQLVDITWYDGQNYYDGSLVPRLPTGWQILLH